MPWGAIIQAAHNSMEERSPLNLFRLGYSIYQDQRNAGYTQDSINLSREALQAQKAQQAWQNEQYIESRDYNRALQERIFDREDTAMTRSVQDHVNAGFSPLTALGSAFGAGQVISQSSAPGNQVQNNQFSVHDTNYFGEALDSMLERRDSAMSRAVTMLMQTKELTNSKEMQDAEFRHSEDIQKMLHSNQKDILQLQQDYLKDIEDIRQRNKLDEIFSSHQGQVALQRLIAQDNLKLQNDQQDWQDSQPKTRTIDQIAEQGLNWMKENIPEMKSFIKETDNGWEIAFRALYELISRASGDSVEDKLKSYDSSPSNPFQYGTP